MPDVSVVMVTFNMAREAARTLTSLSPVYQRHVRPGDYEVIVVDNGSTEPAEPSALRQPGGTVRHIGLRDAPPSPARAVNTGIAVARGDIIGVMVDGARLVTPGLIHFARHACRIHERAVVITLGWHLGFDPVQSLAVEAGYNAERQEALLSSVDWPSDGYRLFDISALGGTSAGGWLHDIGESNALFMRRELWAELGGMDQQFDAPGGGFVNLDLLRRALELDGIQPVVLLGEGTFHQAHGGSTQVSARELAERIATWHEQYERIRGRRWSPAQLPVAPTFLGTLPRAALLHFARSAVEPTPNPDPPLGIRFDRALWDLAPPPAPADAGTAAVVELAQDEFRARRFGAAAAVARLARRHAPDEPGPQQLLATAGLWLRRAPDETAEVHAALGDALALLGDPGAAEAEYGAALKSDADNVRSHLGLSRLRMPGPDYMVWLQRIHKLLAPATYLEIGVAQGYALALARPPTIAIGVDPVPTVVRALQTPTYIFPEPSDDFFAADRLGPVLMGRPLEFVFIDGLHSFEQAFRDLINVEKYATGETVVAFHDAVPLDEATQSREQLTRFWTGDVWRVVLALREYRPDLEIFTIPASPSGLVVVRGLDPESPVLANAYEEAVERFLDYPYRRLESEFASIFNFVDADWDQVAALLRAHPG